MFNKTVRLYLKGNAIPFRGTIDSIEDNTGYFRYYLFGGFTFNVNDVICIEMYQPKTRQ
jgi:hypothetical protein